MLSSHDVDQLSRSVIKTVEGVPVTLEDMVTLHTGAILLPHVKVEEGAVVGASSVAVRKVKSGLSRRRERALHSGLRYLANR